MTNSITAHDLKKLLEEKKPVTLLDVRRKNDHDIDPRKIPGAVWHDPEKLDEWIDRLPTQHQAIAYCVKGGSVSQGIADTLQQKGLSALFLEGGLKSWLDNGNTTEL